MRQTGRTQRMLDETVEAARAGNYCFLVAANEMEVGRLTRSLSYYEGARVVGGDKVYFGAGSISVIPRADQNVDLGRGTYRGAHPSTHFFADHFALEEAFREALPWAWQEWSAAQPQRED